MLQDTSTTAAILVDVATITPDRITTMSSAVPDTARRPSTASARDSNAMASASLQRITQPGRFVVAIPKLSEFAAQTLLFASGRVTDTLEGLPAVGAVVQSLWSAIPSMTDAEGSYVVHLGYLEQLLLPARTTLLAFKSASSQGGAITPLIARQVPLPGGARILPIPMNLPIAVVTGNPIVRAEDACMRCTEEIKAALQKTLDNEQAELKALFNKETITFPGPLTLATGQQQTFSSHPFGSSPLLSIEPPQAFVCGELTANIPQLSVYGAAVSLKDAGTVNKAIAALLALNIVHLGLGEFRVDATLEGETPGITALIASIALDKIGAEAAVEVQELSPIFCPSVPPAELSLDRATEPLFAAVNTPVTVTAGPGGSQCGNGRIEAGEVCDGTNLGGKQCTDFGFTSGVLSCASDCRAFDFSQCSSPPPPPGSCELVTSGDRFVKIVNALGGQTGVEVLFVGIPSEVILLGADIRPGACEVYGFTPSLSGNFRLEITQCVIDQEEGECTAFFGPTKKITFAVQQGETHTITLDRGFFQ